MLDITSVHKNAIYSCFLAVENERNPSCCCSASRYKLKTDAVRSTDLRQTLHEAGARATTDLLIPWQSESTRLMTFNTLRRAGSVLCWDLKPKLESTDEYGLVFLSWGLTESRFESLHLMLILIEWIQVFRWNEIGTIAGSTWQHYKFSSDFDGTNQGFSRSSFLIKPTARVSPVILKTLSCFRWAWFTVGDERGSLMWRRALRWTWSPAVTVIFLPICFSRLQTSSFDSFPKTFFQFQIKARTI